MIRKHTRRAAKAAFAISLGVAIVIGVFAAAFTRQAHATTTASPTIIIGTKNFAEEYILGQLYKQALEAKGFKVSYKENIGATEIVHPALTSGKINFYPEYTGVVVQVVESSNVVAKHSRRDLPAREGTRGEEGHHGAYADAVQRHGRPRGDERHGEEVRPEVGRRPHEGRRRSSSAAPRPARRARPASSGTRSGTGSRRRRSSRSGSDCRTRLSTRARSWRRTSSPPTRRWRSHRSTLCLQTRSMSRAFRT